MQLSKKATFALTVLTTAPGVVTFFNRESIQQWVQEKRAIHQSDSRPRYLVIPGNDSYIMLLLSKNERVVFHLPSGKESPMNMNAYKTKTVNGELQLFVNDEQAEPVNNQIIRFSIRTPKIPAVKPVAEPAAPNF